MLTRYILYVNTLLLFECSLKCEETVEILFSNTCIILIKKFNISGQKLNFMISIFIGASISLL